MVLYFSLSKKKLIHKTYTLTIEPKRQIPDERQHYITIVHEIEGKYQIYNLTTKRRSKVIKLLQIKTAQTAEKFIVIKVKLNLCLSLNIKNITLKQC